MRANYPKGRSVSTYTSLRRKPWYPREKQPRYAAKLSGHQHFILKQVFMWEWVLNLWLKQHPTARPYPAVKGVRKG
jgi:hypothetical protein